MLAEENPGNGWYEVAEDIDGKIFKLVSGAPVVMTEEEKDAYYLSLKTTYSYANLRSERNEITFGKDCSFKSVLFSSSIWRASFVGRELYSVIKDEISSYRIP